MQLNHRRSGYPERTATNNSSVPETGKAGVAKTCVAKIRTVKPGAVISSAAKSSAAKSRTGIAACLSLTVHAAIVFAVLSMQKAVPEKTHQADGISISLDIFTSPAASTAASPHEASVSQPETPASQPEPAVQPPIEHTASRQPEADPDPIPEPEKIPPNQNTLSATPTAAKHPKVTATMPTPVMQEQTTAASQSETATDSSSAEQSAPAKREPTLPVDKPTISVDAPASNEQPLQPQVTLVTTSSTVDVPNPLATANKTVSNTENSTENSTENNTGNNSKTNTQHSNTAEKTGGEHTDYAQEVRMAVVAQRSYPQRARRKQLTGTVVVAFRIFANGTLESTRVASSSGHSILDRAAVNAVRNVGRFKPFPEAVNRHYLDFKVPVVFQ